MGSSVAEGLPCSIGLGAVEFGVAGDTIFWVAPGGPRWLGGAVKVGKALLTDGEGIGPVVTGVPGGSP